VSAKGLGLGFGGKIFAGTRGFDPVTIILQIVSLQFIYYLTLSLSLQIANFFLAPSLRPHLGQLFSPSSLDHSLPAFASTLLGHALNLPLTVFSLCSLVEKANKCLDFTATIFFYHFLFTWATYEFPSTLSWWAAHALIVTVTVLVAEFACLKLETAEIKLDFGHIIQEGVKGAQKYLD